MNKEERLIYLGLFKSKAQLMHMVIDLENKINQLETNRDEAIEFIKKKKLNCELYGEQTFSVDDLLSILERGKYDS